MSQSPTQSKKPKLNRKALKEHGIRFYEIKNDSNHTLLTPIYHNITRMQAKLPEHAKKTMNNALTEFERSGHDATIAQNQNWDLMPPVEMFCANKSFIRSNIHAKVEKELDECRIISELAVTLRKMKNPEKAWEREIYPKIFRSYDVMYGDSDEHRGLFKRWELHADVYWNECSLGELTSPKPDLTYAFPIINAKQGIALKHGSDRQVKSFSLPVLQSLQSTQKGRLRPSPNSNLRSLDPNKPETGGAAELMCFPWAIVELKTTPWKADQTEFCYCQAANASAHALIMREEVAKKAHDPSREALVIFSFTCVGPNVRLWLTYRSLKRGFVRMRCIWATSLELAWGVFSLRSKIENVREWVYDRVKPELARWIEAARGVIPRVSLVHKIGVIKQIRKDTSQRRHSEGSSIISSQDTQRLNRSNAPSPAFDRSECSLRRRVERCKDKDDAEKHCSRSYEAKRHRDNSEKARSSKDGSDTEEDEGEEEDDDDDKNEEDEGYFSPCKKKGARSITPTPSRHLQGYQHGIFCICPKETCWITDNEDNGNDEQDEEYDDEDKDEREDYEALLNAFSSLSLSNKKKWR